MPAARLPGRTWERQRNNTLPILARNSPQVSQLQSTLNSLTHPFLPDTQVTFSTTMRVGYLPLGQGPFVMQEFDDTGKSFLVFRICPLRPSLALLIAS